MSETTESRGNSGWLSLAERARNLKCTLVLQMCSSFCTQQNYNLETKENFWLSVIGDSHDSFCGCWFPFAHLLDKIFPIDHKDRHKTIHEIIERDLKECLSGGQGETNGTHHTGTEEITTRNSKEREEDQRENSDTEDLLDAAVAAAEER